MSRYRVSIERLEHYTHQVEVEAETMEEAERKARIMDVNDEFADLWEELQPEVTATYEAEEIESAPSEPEAVPKLDVCPMCGKDAACIVHPAFDGGAYVRCCGCGYSDQVKTWSPTDAGAAKKWNAERNEGR